MAGDRVVGLDGVRLIDDSGDAIGDPATLKLGPCEEIAQAIWWASKIQVSSDFCSFGAGTCFPDGISPIGAKLAIFEVQDKTVGFECVSLSHAKPSYGLIIRAYGRRIFVWLAGVSKTTVGSDHAVSSFKGWVEIG